MGIWIKPDPVDMVYGVVPEIMGWRIIWRIGVNK